MPCPLDAPPLIRVARAADRDGAHEVTRQAWSRPPRVGWFECLLDRAAEAPDRRGMWVAVVEERVVGLALACLFPGDGSVTIHAAPPGWYLLSLAVSRALRRRGIGAALTRTRLAWMRQRGAVAAYYFQEAGNDASRALHRPFGFEVVGGPVVFPGTEGEGDLLFRAPLAG